MAYSQVADLLTGNIVFATGFDKQVFVDNAADEIDSIIGPRYVTPVNPTGLADYSAKELKKVSNWLATGRLILTVDVGDEGKALHAYALDLVKAALTELRQIATGALDLQGAALVDTSATATNGPTILNHDSNSAVDAFENFVNRWHPLPFPRPPYGPPFWQPGEDDRTTTGA